jgi:diacylglycerol kinase
VSGPPSDEFHPPDRTWRQKFRDAFRGLRCGLRDQSSFHVHAVVAVAVLACAAVLRATYLEWAALLLCIALVIVAEMFNTALEHLAKAVDRSRNVHLGNALDIGSAAVLLAACGSVAAGGLVLCVRFVAWWRG